MDVVMDINLLFVFLFFLIYFREIIIAFEVTEAVIRAVD